MMPKFPSKYIHSAILIAFWAGINMGAHVAFTVGFDFPLGKGFHAYIQTHGYLQLMGWIGLFVMGVSIHFLSRLAHFENINKLHISAILVSMVSGLFLRFITHSFLPFINEPFWYYFLGWGTIFSGILVLSGIILYLVFLYNIIQNIKPSFITPNRDIRIFLMMNIFGWLIYGVGNQILLINMVINHDISILHNWHLFLTDIFIHFTIFSICIAVSIRALPLFLRLPSIKWNVRSFSILYLIIISLIFGFKILFHFVYISWFPKMIYSFSILKNLLLIWFIIRLDILFKSKLSWISETNHERKPRKITPRKSLPDYGEFGRFEWLIRSAFFWQFVGLIFDILLHAGLITKIQMGINIDGIRHMWLAGFTSLLIMGMAVRMIPGMTGAMKLTHPNRVVYLSIIINISVLFRVLSAIIPEQALILLPFNGTIATRMFGLSGLIFLFGLGIFYYIMKPVLKCCRN
ncbi:MAG: hypothetical protein HOA15_03665 [Candidatus Marinimicrobia bacterium]|nr:hypothetical protein [Candidatus Neomarinimicrobiota bacterium]MBT3675057.1 hypothetical protein [Candidatus Neomarinimicrobiota bacterium]MBT3763634.1 hypothetical protein [Candidatus Neomarinimicrobiota bacterium]MBT4068834.1 hypothetical protein [Candidatus Neomarinimicrobiota bacterium]MBT4271286.1 hypothetical protein [Candidatus Neomarinimicrobiota bacterium]